MVIDSKEVEHIVEVITRELLLALIERDQPQQPQNGISRGEYAEGLYVKTCSNEVDQW